MNPTVYPIALDLANRHCLVVGGGPLAYEKVEGLLRAGARVVVVSPNVSPELASRADAGEIEVYLRPYRQTDLDGVYLAYGADEDRPLNATVAQHARAAGILVNAVDDIPNCDFFAVSIVRRGDLQIAISTNGLSPALARWLREYLDARLPNELGALLRVLAQVRSEVRVRGPIPPYERWRAAITGDVMGRLKHGDDEGARSRVLAVLTGQQDIEFETEPATLWPEAV